MCNAAAFIVIKLLVASAAALAGIEDGKGFPTTFQLLAVPWVIAIATAATGTVPVKTTVPSVVVNIS